MFRYNGKEVGAIARSQHEAEDRLCFCFIAPFIRFRKVRPAPRIDLFFIVEEGFERAEFHRSEGPRNKYYKKRRVE